MKTLHLVIFAILVISTMTTTNVFAQNVPVMEKNMTPAYLIPQELDSKIVLVILLTLMSITAMLVIHFSRNSKIVIPKGIAAMRIFFAVFSMMLLSVISFLPFNIMYKDSFDVQVFSTVGAIFSAVSYPITHTTSFVLEHFGITQGPLENIVGNYVIVITFGVVSVIATYGMWTRRSGLGRCVLA